MNSVLITGTARGYGLALTKQFAALGWQVFAGARDAANRGKLQSVQRNYPDTVVPIDFDVTDDHERYRTYQIVSEKTDSLDVIINNAGINAATSNSPESHVSLGDLRGEKILHMFRINTVAPLQIVQRFSNLLKNSENPRVVNVSSISGSIANKSTPGNYSYAASKAALNMVTRSLALELEPSGVVVVSVHPGHLQTRMGGPNGAVRPEDSAERLAELTESLSLEDSGHFVNTDGERIDW